MTTLTFKEGLQRLEALDAECRRIVGFDPTDKNPGDSVIRMMTEYRRLRSVIVEIRKLSVNEH